MSLNPADFETSFNVNKTNLANDDRPKTGESKHKMFQSGIVNDASKFWFIITAYLTSPFTKEHHILRYH